MKNSSESPTGLPGEWGWVYSQRINNCQGYQEQGYLGRRQPALGQHGGGELCKCLQVPLDLWGSRAHYKRGQVPVWPRYRQLRMNASHQQRCEAFKGVPGGNQEQIKLHQY